MDFNRQIFEQVKQVIPNLTTRTFSRYLGKSEGYYGSINAQNIAISTNSLLYLAEILESYKELKQLTEHKAAIVNDIQNTIAGEVASRAHAIDCDNHRIREMVLKSIAKINLHNDYACYPFVVVG